jgi:hypothetical protein
METQPRKSRAFLITFIVVIVLLIIAYVIFNHRSTPTNTQGTTDANGNPFTPLDNSNGQKDVTTVGGSNGSNTNNGSGTGATGTNGTGSSAGDGTGGSNTTAGDSSSNNGGFQVGGGADSGSGFGTSGNNTGGDSGFGNGGGFDGSGGFAPVFNPIPTPGPNDNTPSNGNNTPSGNPNTPDGNPGGNGTDNTPNNPQTNLALCPDDPLVFTDAEQAELDDLTQQYYLLASNLRSNNEISILTNEFAQDQALIKQANQLTAQCQAEKADPSYTGPQTVKDNPYYAGFGSEASSYLPGQASEWVKSELEAEAKAAIKKQIGESPLSHIGDIFSGNIGLTLIGSKIPDYGALERVLGIW